MPEWWENGDEVHRTARWLVANGEISEPMRVVDYFEKPWKWTPEREHMLNHERLEKIISERDADTRDGTPRANYRLEQRVESECSTCTPKRQSDEEEDCTIFPEDAG